ncbi:MAG: TetR/AcrR family transcriptional regulator [Bacteroidia bacterium]|nr:TetR/AcrR family transcriptional regulator [Bacteroidia bacterium]
MNKAQRTRRYIIEKTAPVFNRQGFTGTSLSDLTRTTGLTKGSIYGNFRDKEEIAREAFVYAIEKIRETSRSRMATQATSRQKLLALFSFLKSMC